MSYQIPQGRIKPKKESTFGKVKSSKGSFGKPKKENQEKKPFSGLNRNRKGLKQKKIATDIELEFLGWIKEQSDLKCFCCSGNDGLEAHHVKLNSTYKKNHKEVILLCGEKCHRNGLGLSAHSTPKKFRETFPIVVQLVYAHKLYNRFIKERI